MTKLTKVLPILLILSILFCSIGFAEATQVEATLEVPNVTIREPVRVEIFFNPALEPIILEGTILHIASRLYNAEDIKSVSYAWYVDRGNGYELIPTATKDYYEFSATKASLSWSFKLVVTYEQ